MNKISFLSIQSSRIYLILNDLLQNNQKHKSTLIYMIIYWIQNMIKYLFLSYFIVTKVSINWLYETEKIGELWYI